MMRICFTFLLSLFPLMTISSAAKKLNITVDNSNTDYKWTINYNSACDDPDDPTDYDHCSTKNLDGGSWSDIETIKAGKTLKFTLVDANSSGPNLTFGYTNDPDGTLANYGQSLSFTFRASKERASSSCSGNKSDNNSYVKSGFAYITETECDGAKATGGWDCSGSSSANSTFTIYYPPAPQVVVTLPTSSSDSILNQTLLQETYDKLDPKLLNKFDTYQNNPVVVESNELQFFEPCTSEGCWYTYCDGASSTSGCSTKYLNGCS